MAEWHCDILLNKNRLNMEIQGKVIAVLPIKDGGRQNFRQRGWKSREFVLETERKQTAEPVPAADERQHRLPMRLVSSTRLCM